MKSNSADTRLGIHLRCVLVNEEILLASGNQCRNKLMRNQLKEERPKYVERVLDVRQGELCWVVGTVYLELKMKPNVLDDLTKEARILHCSQVF